MSYRGRNSNSLNRRRVHNSGSSLSGSRVLGQGSGSGDSPPTRRRREDTIVLSDDSSFEQRLRVGHRKNPITIGGRVLDGLEPMRSRLLDNGPSSSTALSKEEQERRDAEFARNLQEEEERLARNGARPVEPTLTSDQIEEILGDSATDRSLSRETIRSFLENRRDRDRQRVSRRTVQFESEDEDEPSLTQHSTPLQNRRRVPPLRFQPDISGLEDDSDSDDEGIRDILNRSRNVRAANRTVNDQDDVYDGEMTLESIDSDQNNSNRQHRSSSGNILEDSHLNGSNRGYVADSFIVSDEENSDESDEDSDTDRGEYEKINEGYNGLVQRERIANPEVYPFTIFNNEISHLVRSIQLGRRNNVSRDSVAASSDFSEDNATELNCDVSAQMEGVIVRAHGMAVACGVVNGHDVNTDDDNSEEEVEEYTIGSDSDEGSVDNEDENRHSSDDSLCTFSDRLRLLVGEYDWGHQLRAVRVLMEEMERIHREQNHGNEDDDDQENDINEDEEHEADEEGDENEEQEVLDLFDSEPDSSDDELGHLSNNAQRYTDMLHNAIVRHQEEWRAGRRDESSDDSNGEDEDDSADDDFASSSDNDDFAQRRVRMNNRNLQIVRELRALRERRQAESQASNVRAAEIERLIQAARQHRISQTFGDMDRRREEISREMQSLRDRVRGFQSGLTVNPVDLVMNAERRQQERPQEQEEPEVPDDETVIRSADFGHCTICFEELPYDPVGCLYCQQLVGCRKCISRWWKLGRNSRADSPLSLGQSGGNHRQCPLCRHEWDGQPEVTSMFNLKE